MSFIIDKQTLNDLKIFEKGKGNSIFGIFNDTRTKGGSLVLEDMFRYPLSDVDKINKRSSIIKFFKQHELKFDFNNEWFDAIEHYLSNTDDRTRLSKGDNNLQRKIKGYVGGDTQYEQINKGVLSCIGIICSVNDFINKVDISNDNPYIDDIKNIVELINNPIISWAVKESPHKKLQYKDCAEYDGLLRYDGNQILKKLLYYIYNIDVYISIAKIATERGFIFGKCSTQTDNNILEMEGIYHPLLKKPIANTIHVGSDKNIIFLTGANMAGKSTFMKTFGVVLFLAHMGFPLPAKKLEFSVQKGMYTTINMPDNLNMGYSHFYAEILRLKKVAEQISRTENMIIIFDELFRGTNVKDAHEATVAVTQAFANKKRCTFMISTHIIEAGDDIKASCNNVNYIYLPTVMNGNIASYTYTVTQGITSDRHGMMIINNERIVETLRNRKKRA